MKETQWYEAYIILKKVELFQFVDGVNVDLMKQPVAKIFYDELLYDFDEDEAYSVIMKPQIEELKATLLAQIELNINCRRNSQTKSRGSCKVETRGSSQISCRKTKSNCRC